MKDLNYDNISDSMKYILEAVKKYNKIEEQKKRDKKNFNEGFSFGLPIGISVGLILSILIYLICKI
jgi:hypothetical protein